MMFSDIIFYFGLSLLFLHEMDAIKRKEWRMIYPFFKFSDEIGYYIFTAIHLPIIYSIFHILLFCDKEFVSNFKIILSFFFILHLLLHFGFIKHRKNELNTLFSWLIISLMGICGILFLLFR